MHNPEVLVVLVNASSEDEALRIARAVVDERLAASANLIPNVRSIYRWKGSVEAELETTMVIKTVPGRLQALTRRIVDLHSYDVPEVIALSVIRGHEPYLNWVRKNTTS